MNKRITPLIVACSISAFGFVHAEEMKYGIRAKISEESFDASVCQATTTLLPIRDASPASATPCMDAGFVSSESMLRIDNFPVYPTDLFPDQNDQKIYHSPTNIRYLPKNYLQGADFNQVLLHQMNLKHQL